MAIDIRLEADVLHNRGWARSDRLRSKTIPEKGAWKALLLSLYKTVHNNNNRVRRSGTQDGLDGYNLQFTKTKTMAKKTQTSTTELGFEDKLWKAADNLRGNIDAAEYKSVILGLIFLKHISDRFEARYRELVEEGEG